MAKSTDRLRMRARALYRVGWAQSQIADLLDRSPKTISRWKMEDRKRGVDWESRREEYFAQGPGACLQAVQQHRAEVARDPDISEDERTDALLKLGKVARRLEAEIAGVTGVVTALAKMRRWAMEQGLNKSELDELEQGIGHILCERFDR